MSIVANNPAFLHQLKSDMEWLINTPSLVKTDDLYIETSHIPNLSATLEKKSKLIESIFENAKNTVGDYFERLVYLWLELQPQYTNIEQHIKVFENKRTIGELDFLLSDDLQNLTLHLEVAIKYYLLTEKNGERQFIGPNSKDTFLKKFNKLNQKQLKLPQSPFAETVLTNRPKPIVSRGLLKGCLFYPSNSDWRAPASIYSSINAKHTKGWWTSIDKLNLPQTSPDSHWIVLKKPFWLALPDVNQTQIFTHHEIKNILEEHFSKLAHPVFLAEVMQIQNKWLEQSRGFVVNKNWPE